jgi:hypothetical protein
MSEVEYSGEGGEEKSFTERSFTIRKWLREGNPSVVYVLPEKEIILAGLVKTADEFYANFTENYYEGTQREDVVNKIWTGRLIGASYRIDRRTDEEIAKKYKAKTKTYKHNFSYVKVFCQFLLNISLEKVSFILISRQFS